MTTGPAQENIPDFHGSRDTMIKSELEGTADGQSSYLMTDANNRKRSRAIDFSDNDGELSSRGRSTKTRRVSGGSRSSTFCSHPVYSGRWYASSPYPRPCHESWSTRGWAEVIPYLHTSGLEADTVAVFKRGPVYIVGVDMV